MADGKPVAVAARDVAARSTTIYPPEYSQPLMGRAKRALGNVFGLDQFGVNLTELAPGASSSERHWHKNEDEFIYVLDGEVTLVDDAGEHLLGPGMCAGFKAGVANGHKLINKTAKFSSYLEIGTRSAEELATYPDADMVGIKENHRFRFARKDGTPYPDSE
jgi:uncharacterized cupin superfamily protein